MTVKAIHEFLENNCKLGAGFAIKAQTVLEAIKKIIADLATTGPTNTDLELDQSSTVRFSFLFDAASLTLSTDLELSIDLTVWLHPKNKPLDPIVTVKYTITKARLEPLYDASISEFCWISKSLAMSISKEDWGTDQALIDAGFETAAHTADKTRFLEEIYYGFKWLNARNLLPSIIRNIPFPQVQRWFLPFALQFPFENDRVDGYLVVWTDRVLNIFDNCGPSQTPSTPAKGIWRVKPGSPAPSSPYDNGKPPFALYIAATNLVSWQAGQLAPAVLLHDAGGGFIRWSYDLAVAVTALTLDLIPAPNGGGLALALVLRLAGQASAWIDGPSGSRLSLATATVTADGNVDASAVVEYFPKLGRIDLETTIHASIDKKSIDISGGGLFSTIQADIIELLIKTGVFKIDTSYYSQTRMPLIDLKSFCACGSYKSNPAHRYELDAHILCG